MASPAEKESLLTRKAEKNFRDFFPTDFAKKKTMEAVIILHLIVIFTHIREV